MEPHHFFIAIIAHIFPVMGNIKDVPYYYYFFQYLSFALDTLKNKRKEIQYQLTLLPVINAVKS